MTATVGVGLAVLALVAGFALALDRGIPNMLELAAIRLLAAAKRMRARRAAIEAGQRERLAEVRA